MYVSNFDPASKNCNFIKTCKPSKGKLLFEKNKFKMLETNPGIVNKSVNYTEAHLRV